MRHRDSQASHSIRRARERYGLRLRPSDLEEMVRTIRRGGSKRTKLVGAAEGGRELWLIGWGSDRYPAVYDPQTMMVCTFVPQDALDRLVLRSTPLGRATRSLEAVARTLQTLDTEARDEAF